MGTKTGRPTDREKAQQVGKSVKYALEVAALPGFLGAEIAGSVRRGQKKTVSDVDLVVWSEVDDLTAWVPQWSNRLYAKNIRWTPKGGVGELNDVVVELYKAPSLDCVGATMLFTTGPASLNVYMRRMAQKKGWKLSQYGIKDADGARVDACDGADWLEDEGRMFDALGLPRLTPEHREEWARHIKTTRQ